MTNKPERRARESVLAYYLRLAEWERLYKEEMAVEMRAIDRLVARPKFQNHRSETKQVQLDRRSLYEIAENNPVLRKVLRKLQSNT